MNCQECGAECESIIVNDITPGSDWSHQAWKCPDCRRIWFAQ